MKLRGKKSQSKKELLEENSIDPPQISKKKNKIIDKINDKEFSNNESNQTSNEVIFKLKLEF